MKYIVSIPNSIYLPLQQHLLQNDLEQGAFLFGRASHSSVGIFIVVESTHKIQPDGWEFQDRDYLQMKDLERAKIMKIARDGNFAIIDCHSHPGSKNNVWFSLSDRRGITEFAAYAKWKLDGKPYTAMVWSESSVDAVSWHSDFKEAQRVHEVRIVDKSIRNMTPKGSWFRKIRIYT